MSKLYEIHAYILHKRQVSAEKAQIICFSQEQGRLTIWARFKAKNKTRGLYEPFLPLWMMLKIEQSWLSIQSVELERQANPLSGDALWCGWYVNELLMHLSRPDDVNESLYQAYETTLNALSQTTDPQSLQMILRRFEWALLQALGLAISLKQEATGKGPILDSKHYQCVPNLGLVEAPSGFSGEQILALAAGDWAHAGLLPAAKHMMRLLLDDVLEGRVLKTRHLFRGMHVIES